MGIGFTSDCRWVFPILSHLSTNPSIRLNQSYPYKDRGASFEPVKVSSLYTIPEGSRTVPAHTLEWPYGTVGNLNSDSTKREGVQVNTSESLPSTAPILFNIVEDSAIKDITTHSSGDSVQYTLLLEGLTKIEGILLDTDLLKLEREILTQIRRLGALKMFQTCLSRSFVESDGPIKDNIPHIKQDSVCPRRLQEDVKKDRVTIRSPRREARKLKRKRALEKLSASSSLCCSTRTDDKFPMSDANHLSRATGSSSSSRRARIARNESKMAMGFKEAASLEKVRLKLEEETGNEPSSSRWAEAAAIDEKTLLQRLSFGWHCRDGLLKSTRSLVVYHGKKYLGLGLGFEDLIQAGNIGVLLGAERFDISRGYKFSTYAGYWIRKTISASVARHSKGIRVPVTTKKVIKQIQMARRSLASSTRIHPGEDELAEFTGLPLNKIRLANKCSRTPGSIDQILWSGMNVKYSEVTPDTSIDCPELTVMKHHMRNNVHMLLEDLNPREKEVLLLRYGFGDGRCKSLAEIGNHFNVSKERIRKIEKASLARAREKNLTKMLRHYQDIVSA